MANENPKADLLVSEEMLNTYHTDGVKPAIDKLDSIPRPNLLKNWNFSNPVNTLGKSNYTSSLTNDLLGTRCIDGWGLYSENNSAEFIINNGYCTLNKISGVSSATMLKRFLPIKGKLDGKKCTASALLYDGTLISNSFYFPVDQARVTPIIPGGFQFTIVNGTTAVGAATNEICVWLRKDGDVDLSVNIVAMKLEIGEGQTLCHKENGVWVLNEVENTEPWQNTNQISAMQEAGAVNHLDVDAVSQVVRGITYTVNSDKSITMNGTNTDSSQSVLWLNTDYKDCSALAGKNATFGGFDVGIPVISGYAQCFFYDSSNTEIVSARATARWADAVVFVPSNAVKYRAALFVNQGATINNVTVYPMFYDARLVNPPYQPFTMTNRELTDAIDHTAQKYVSISSATTGASVKTYIFDALSRGVIPYIIAHEIMANNYMVLPLVSGGAGGDYRFGALQGRDDLYYMLRMQIAGGSPSTRFWQTQLTTSGPGTATDMFSSGEWDVKLYY